MKDEIIKLNDGEYFVIDTIVYDNVEYGLANRLSKDDEPLNEYKVVYMEDGNYKVCTNTILLNAILPKLERKITKSLDEENE